MSRIYISPPHMGGEELKLVEEVFASNWVAPVGPQVDAFEKEFSEIVEVPHAAALSSGTAALHLALLLLGVKRGDDVLVSTLTFAATANAIVYVGARPVFIDSEPRSWNLDPDLLQKELGRRAMAGRLPSAVICVDLYGQCADYELIQPICRDFDVPLIEDAAEALGATYQGRPAGGFGVFGVFSFNGNKILTTSGGGMLVSSDPKLIERARFLATQAREPAPHYEHSVIGYNYRLSNVLAAIGRGQLRVLKDRVRARQRNFSRYQKLLGNLPGFCFIPELENGQSTRWLTCVTIDPAEFGATREEVRLALEAQDIEARPVWKPMHLQPVFKDCQVVGGKVAEELFRNGLCLPSGSSLKEDQIERISTIVRGQCKRLGSRDERGLAPNSMAAPQEVEP